MPVTKDDLAKLVALQEYDRTLDALRVEISGIPGRIAALNSEAEAERGALAEAKDKSARLVIKRKEKENQMAQKEEEARKYGRDLNSVKTNEAFRALQTEIDRCKAAAGEIETEILLIMEEGDQLVREEKEKTASLKAAEVRVQEKVKVLESCKAEAEAKLAEEKARRDAYAAGIPAEMVSQYDAIRVRRSGVAVSRLDGKTCGACRMNQPPQAMVNVAKGTKLVLCESCQRILYSPEIAGKPA
ncbi:MAG: C4-type zinc ribbon domain-containing protein [Elusimicrobiota bacterium]|jgi:hypothetical protein